MKRNAMVAATLVFAAAIGVHAQGPQASTAEEFEAKLGYQTGTVTLNGGMAKIQLPASFRFIGPEGSRRLLTEAWGNPPGAAEGVLGMLIPTASSPLSKGGWGIVITFDEDGYVNDSDAAKMDYGKLLKQMQEQATESNEARRKQGFQTVRLVGWAEPPSYDSATHKMYWAKDLVFSDEPDHTLNYSIRILGRRGVLVLNAVASMDQLTAIRGEAKNVLAAIEFNEGHRYTDFLPGKDKAAAYGLAGLLVGATAVKAGFFKLLWVGILAFKKVIIVGAVALLGALKRLFGGGKQTA
ncbi:MAG TPA: DUF2167 domain-containing protein, partial [Vicinamibacterales bacterium]|nr:DUF2167 domain-containing protein [Vicinamibacterales bacterium]